MQTLPADVSVAGCGIILRYFSGLFADCSLGADLTSAMMSGEFWGKIKMQTMVQKVSGAAAAALLMSGVAAHAATESCTSATTYSLSDATAAECFTGNDTPQIDSLFSMFGMTGWVLSEKNDGPDGDGLIEFVTAPINGASSGRWSIDTLAGLSSVVITLKAGRGFGAFLLDLSVADPLSGTWSAGKDLSHASIYYNGQGTPPAPIPLPATLPLLAIALGGLGFGLRRKSKG